MFIVSILLFISGIYVQAFYNIKVSILFLILVFLFILSSIFLMRQKASVIIFILLSFFVAGMFRLSLGMVEEPALETYRDPSVFSATVEERSHKKLILNIKYPSELRGLKAIFRSNDPSIDTGDTLTIFGKIRESVPAHKNPHLISWRWVKSLDNVRYEIRGEVIDKEEGCGLIANLRRLAKKKIERLGLPQEGIIKALAIGDRSLLDSRVQDTFQRTGTSHVLAISGLHMGIVGAIVFYLVRLIARMSCRMRLSGNDRKVAAFLSIPVLVFFMFFFGTSPSTVRATIMIGIYMISILLEKERELLSTLALSGLIILVFDPESLFVPSFQLSFMSVLFIVLFYKRVCPLLEKIKNRCVKWIVTSAITTQSAFLGTFPIVLYHFYGINPLSFVHNIISVPILCGITVPLVLFGVFLPYGGFLLKISDFIISVNVRILESFGYGYIYPFFRPLLFESLLYYSFLIASLHLRQRIVRHLIFCILILLVLVHSYTVYENRYGKSLCVNFLDVGLGDAILIEAPAGVRLLVDSGGSYGDFNPGKSIVTPVLLSKKIMTLDYMVITHPHMDHIGGAPYIMENFDVKNLLTTRDLPRNENGIKLFEIAMKKGVRVHLLKEGDAITLGNDLILSVFNPPANFLFEDINANSIVFKLSYGNVSFLFTGDITEKVESRLAFSDASLGAHILKVPHHGSSSSSTPFFLYRVNPKIAVLSGQNMENIPSKKVMELYNSMGIPLLSTYRHGCVVICTDGKKLRIKTYGAAANEL